MIKKTKVINDNINEVTINFSIRTARSMINKTIAYSNYVGRRIFRMKSFCVTAAF